MSGHPVTVRNTAEGASSTPGAVAAVMGRRFTGRCSSRQRGHPDLDR